MTTSSTARLISRLLVDSLISKHTLLNGDRLPFPDPVRE